MMTPKPYHLMTPAERLAERIAKNKAIDSKIASVQAAQAAKQAASNQRAVAGAFRDLLGVVDAETRSGLIEIMEKHKGLLKI